MQPLVTDFGALALEYYPTVDNIQVFAAGNFFDIHGSVQPRVKANTGVSIAGAGQFGIQSIITYPTFTRYNLDDVVGVTATTSVTFDDYDWLGNFGSEFDLQLTLGSFGYDFNSGQPITIITGQAAEVNEENENYSYYFKLPIVKPGTRITFVCELVQTPRSTVAILYATVLNSTIHDFPIGGETFPAGGTHNYVVLEATGDETWTIIQDIPGYSYTNTYLPFNKSGVTGNDAANASEKVMLATDLLTPVHGNTAVGGGSETRFVWSNGTVWKVI
jgi:hypothetical protein